MTHIYEPSEQLNDKKLYPDGRLPVSALSNPSAVSWGAIFAGAAATASLALMLLMLGAGLGLTSVSPWENKGLDAGTVGIVAIVWMAFTQIAASGMGGYIAGRLRTKWVDTKIDEIYFRDTAHGFLTWAVALIVSAVLLTTTIGAIVGGGAKVVGSVAGGAAATTVAGLSSMDKEASVSDSSTNYFIRSLFRTDDRATTETNSQAMDTPVTTGQPAPRQDVFPEQVKEVTGIFAHAISSGTLPSEDRQYVARLISQRTGISQQEAEQRVQTGYDKAQAAIKETKVKAQQAAEKARKASSYITLWTFISLLIGAFTASFSATLGGRQRDL